MSRTPQIRAKDLRGIFGFMLTPVKDQEITKHTQNAVDIDEAARGADALVRDGIDGLAINSTFGEVPSLTWEEAKAFTGTVIEAVRGRVPVFAGVTTLNTRDTITRARAYRDMGAVGLMLGRPMLTPLSDQNAVQYFRDLAGEFPDTAIYIYENEEVFKRPLTTAVFAELAKIPNIVACKYRTKLLVGAAAKNTFDADLEAVGDRIKIMTQERDWLFAYKSFGLDACWSSSICAGPAPHIVLRDALYAGKWDEAKKIIKELQWTTEGLVPNGDFELWHEDKIPFMKARFNAAGYFKAGPTLPPYAYITPKRLEQAQELGRRGRELHDRYSRLSAAGAGTPKAVAA